MAHSFDSISKKQIDGFSVLLAGIDVNDLHLEEYQKSYLNKLLIYKDYFLRIYAGVLNLVLSKTTKAREDIFLVDYGAGNGLFGLFAGYCGLGKIVQVDTSPEFIESQQALSKALGIVIAENLKGDYEMLRKFHSQPPDMVIGTDVIEHIYDLDKFFSTLRELNSNLIIAFTTASNDRNWWKKRKLMHMQQKDEWEGYDMTNGNESYLPFRVVRKNIILDQLPDVGDSGLEKLITHTRGLRKDDIIKACDLYSEKKILPLLISHPTNTCDPVSESWTERFLSFEEYHSLFDQYGFELTIENGFYNGYQKNFKGFMLKLLNIIINISGSTGSRISPFITLIGESKPVR